MKHITPLTLERPVKAQGFISKATLVGLLNNLQTFLTVFSAIQNLQDLKEEQP